MLASRACVSAGFPVPVAAPIAWAALASLPMALAVQGVAHSLPLAVATGVLTYAATLAAAWRLLPAHARRVIGGWDPSSVRAIDSSGGTG